MYKPFLLLSLIIIAGCDISVNQLKIDTFTAKCPQQSPSLSESENLEIDNISVSRSVLLIANTGKAYQFQAKSGQLLDFNLDNEGICTWVFDPSGNLVNLKNSAEISIDGTYSVYVWNPHGSKTFNLTMKLKDKPQPVVTSNAKEELALNTDLIGTWEGIFVNAPNSQLIIENQSGNLFTGTLITTGKEGSIYHLAVEGDINPNTNKITMKEVKVLKKPSSGIWYLGNNTGTLSTDKNQISGSGKDSKGNQYSWSFQRIKNTISEQTSQTQKQNLTSPNVSSSNSQDSDSNNYYTDNAQKSIKDYYGQINQGYYQRSWNLLSENFIRENSLSYYSYEEWWRNVEKVNLDQIKVYFADAHKAYLYVKLSYVMDNGKIIYDSSPYIYLNMDSNSQTYLIDKKSSKSSIFD